MARNLADDRLRELVLKVCRFILLEEEIFSMRTFRKYRCIEDLLLVTVYIKVNVPLFNWAQHLEDVWKLYIRWRWVVSFKSRLLYPRFNSLWYALDRRSSRLRRRSGYWGCEKLSWPWRKSRVIDSSALTKSAHRLGYQTQEHFRRDKGTGHREIYKRRGVTK